MTDKFIGIRAAKNGYLIEVASEWRDAREPQRWVATDLATLGAIVVSLASKMKEEADGNA